MPLDKKREATIYFSNHHQCAHDHWTGDSWIWSMRQFQSLVQERHNPTKTIKCYYKVIKLDAKKATAWNNVGEAYLRLKESTKAPKCFQSAVKINPEYANGWHNLGIMYGDPGKHAKDQGNDKRTHVRNA